MLFPMHKVAYRAFFLVFLVSSFLRLSAQNAEMATLMSLRGAYYTSDDYTYIPLENGSKLCMGRLGFTAMQYQQLDLPRADSLSFLYQNYISLFDQNDSLLWIKYLSGYGFSASADKQSNIYIAGTYGGYFYTSDGDTLKESGTSSSYYTNMFVLKLDAKGKRKWWYTTHNNAWATQPPTPYYLELDPDNNVYLLGYYDVQAAFNDQVVYYNPYGSSWKLPFLMKLDGSGKFSWGRDWYEDAGLPSGLTIEHDSIYAFSGNDVIQRLRTFDFGGILYSKTTFPGSKKFNTVLTNDIAIRGNRIVLASMQADNLQKMMGFYSKEGKPIWEKDYFGMEFSNLAFTKGHQIFFSGISTDDSISLGDLHLKPGSYFGFMDTTGKILSIKTVPKIYENKRPYLSNKGKVYSAYIINYANNDYSSTYSLDSFHFDHLNYVDPATATMGDLYYRLFAQFKVDDSRYAEPGQGPFDIPADTMLDREGLQRIFPEPFSMQVTSQCRDSVPYVQLKWASSANAYFYDLYKNGVLLQNGLTDTLFADSAVVSGKTYHYQVYAVNDEKMQPDNEGVIEVTIKSCAIETEPDPVGDVGMVQIRIAPNPTHGIITLTANLAMKDQNQDHENGPMQVDIYNMVGNRIFHSLENHVSASVYQKRMDISKVAAGIYLLIVKHGTRVYHYKILKR